MRKLMMTKWLELLTLLLIVVGALNWGLIGAFNVNAVHWLATHTFAPLERVVYVLVGVAALVHIAKRNYYLPFLGDAVYPCGSLMEKTPERADTAVVVSATPNANVIFWAAEPSAQIAENPWLAYASYANAGVTKADAAGRATLRVRSPGRYRVGAMQQRTLPTHIHYRVCTYDGMLSPVKTVFV